MTAGQLLQRMYMRTSERFDENDPDYCDQCYGPCRLAKYAPLGEARNNTDWHEQALVEDEYQYRLDLESLDAAVDTEQANVACTEFLPEL
jgi:hypothetical protein